MAETNVIFVTAVTPSPVGHGGQHRGYQILDELEELVGAGRVLLFTKEHMVKAMNGDGGLNARSGQTGQATGRLQRWAQYRAGTAKRIAQNPYRLVQRTQFATGMHPIICNGYESEVRKLTKPICLLEHTEFGDLIAVNERLGIPTVSCTQNLDSFSQNFELLSTSLTNVQDGKSVSKRKTGVYATAIDFANELQVLARCNERLFISKVETGLIRGFGITAQYYPYVPRGAIRNRQLLIRKRREETGREAGLFVIVGTAKYGPIKSSCEWFIDNVRRHGLPEGVRVLVAGAGTDELLKPGESIPGLECKGWIEQQELDDLLTRASAVLVPQRFGFGAPTRLAELSCAGIRVIGDHHPTYAIDPPPGFSAVDSSWTSWHRKIEELKNNDNDFGIEEYERWEAEQEKPLREVIGRLLN